MAEAHNTRIISAKPDWAPAMTNRLIWLSGIALTLILFGAHAWLTFDRPLSFVAAIPIMFVSWAVFLRRYDPRAALMNSLIGAGIAAMLLAVTLVNHSESGHAWLSRIIVAIFG
jgi:hypothetical protein